MYVYRGSIFSIPWAIVDYPCGQTGKPDLIRFDGYSAHFYPADPSVLPACHITGSAAWFLDILLKELLFGYSSFEM
jgi:hypothetical protein